MPELLQDRLPLMPLAYALLGYLVLQILLNIIGSYLLRRAENPPVAVVKHAFWGNVTGAIYLIIVAALLHIWQQAPNAERPPTSILAWGLGGLPAGIVLWYILAKARSLGIRVFGPSQLIAAEDAILQVLPDARYFGWGIINLAVIQPLGRELFMRGVLLPVVAFNMGWGWAVGITLVIELLLRMNVVWVFVNTAYALIMCGLFYLSGNALCGLVAASIAGLIHAIALSYMTLKAAQQRIEAELAEQAAESAASNATPTEDNSVPSDENDSLG